MSDPPPPVHPHAGHAGEPRSVRCAVLTVSDSRTDDTDRGGPIIAELLQAAHHHVVARQIVRDEPAQIAARLEEWLSNSQIQVIVLTGGTGISRRDVTVETCRPFIDRELEGFGELFRLLSYAEIGSAAMLSRAMAGLVCRPPQSGGDTFLFVLPGSPNGVRLAMEKLIVPELGHLESVVSGQ